MPQLFNRTRRSLFGVAAATPGRLLAAPARTQPAAAPPRPTPVSRRSTTCGLAALTAMLTGCQAPTLRKSDQLSEIGAAIDECVRRNQIRTAGVGIIKAGQLEWSGYYGEQAPGIPASRATLFNVASMTKTVTAETVLRAVAAGKLSLDESMAPFWIDPDIASDPRHVILTPRIALTHTTGFLNWRFFATDGVLRFVNPPGTKFGYSGEGIEYVARFLEKKLGRDFAEIADELVMRPSGMRSTFLKPQPGVFGRIATPYDDKGVPHKPYCRPDGNCRPADRWIAADDMMTTVEDYAAFLASVMMRQGLDEGTARERERVQTVLGGQDIIVNCADASVKVCPTAQGYGLGWEVLDYRGDKILGHTGSDWSEMSIGYFHTYSRDGLIIFLNAPNGRAMTAMPELIDLVDFGSPYSARIRRWQANSGA